MTTRINRSLVSAADALDTGGMTQNIVIQTGFGAASTVWEVTEGINLSNRRAIVTGASSGIGADIARELADRGHGVTLVARREDRLRELADELADRVRVEVIACDVGDSAARAGLFEEVERRGLTVDILVNNAGIGTMGSVTKTPVAEEISQVRVNVEAVVDLTTRAVQQMVPRGRGAILNVGSTAGYQPFPGQVGYAATKAFVNNYTQGLRGELAGTARARCAPSS
jgi:short-subunit dehydrogenase